MKSRVALLVVVLLTCGCASARSNRYARAPQYPPTDPATIQIAYNGIAIASWSGAEKLLREKAAAMGADAVLVLQSGSYVSGYTPAVGTYAWSQAGGTGSGAGTYLGSQPVHRKAAFALAIKFTQRPAATATTSPSVAPASAPPAQEVYHRLFVVALCSDCTAKEVERQIAAGLNGDQVPAVCPAELSDTDHPDQTDVDSLCRWLYARGVDGLIVVGEPGGDSWKGKIALELVDTAKRITVKLYPADNTLQNLSSVSGIGRLLGQWLRQDGYIESTQSATVPPSVAPTIVYGSTPQAAPPQPSAFDQAYQAGMIAIASKDFKAALESFYNAVMLDKSSVLAWTGLGFAHGRSHEFSDAMYCYQVALNLNPTNAAALAGQAEVYGQIGETNKYVETLEKVRQISPVAAAAVAEFVKEQNAQPGADVTPKGNGTGGF